MTAEPVRSRWTLTRQLLALAIVWLIAVDGAVLSDRLSDPPARPAAAAMAPLS